MVETPPYYHTITHATSTLARLRTTSTITPSTLPQPSLTSHKPHITSTITHDASPHYLNHHSRPPSIPPIPSLMSTLPRPSLTSTYLNQHLVPTTSTITHGPPQQYLNHHPRAPSTLPRPSHTSPLHTISTITHIHPTITITHTTSTITHIHPISTNTHIHTT